MSKEGCELAGGRGDLHEHDAVSAAARPPARHLRCWTCVLFVIASGGGQAAQRVTTTDVVLL